LACWRSQPGSGGVILENLSNEFSDLVSMLTFGILGIFLLLFIAYWLSGLVRELRDIIVPKMVAQMWMRRL
jgi:hypothetical protein